MQETLTEMLQDISSGTKDNNISLRYIINSFEERGFGFFLLLFAMPAAIPLPGLGVNIIIALPLLLLTIQQSMGRKSVWFPEKMMDKSVPKEKVTELIEKITPWTKRMELITKPRLQFISQDKMSPIIGIAGLIMTLSICVPLPLTNTIPAFGIAVMAAGLITKDGLAILAGAFIGIVWITLLLVLGTTGVHMLIDLISGAIS